MNKILLFAIFLLSCLNTTAFAACTGLHLQLPNSIIDIKKQDVQELHVFQLDALHSGIMLKLTEKTGNRLAAQTQSLVGEEVVWIWNGRVVGVEKLANKMSQDVNVLNLTKQEAEEISNKLQN